MTTLIKQRIVVSTIIFCLCMFSTSVVKAQSNMLGEGYKNDQQCHE